jgi:hypothetical protein
MTSLCDMNGSLCVNIQTWMNRPEGHTVPSWNVCITTIGLVPNTWMINMISWLQYTQVIGQVGVVLWPHLLVVGTPLGVGTDLIRELYTTPLSPHFFLKKIPMTYWQVTNFTAWNGKLKAKLGKGKNMGLGEYTRNKKNMPLTKFWMNLPPKSLNEQGSWLWWLIW